MVISLADDYRCLDWWWQFSNEVMAHASPTLSSYLKVTGTSNCHKFLLTIERLSSDTLRYEHHGHTWTDTRSHEWDISNWKHKYHQRLCAPGTKCMKWIQCGQKTNARFMIPITLRLQIKCAWRFALTSLWIFSFSTLYSLRSSRTLSQDSHKRLPWGVVQSNVVSQPW